MYTSTVSSDIQNQMGLEHLEVLDAQDFAFSLQVECGSSPTFFFHLPFPLFSCGVQDSYCTSKDLLGLAICLHTSSWQFTKVVMLLMSRYTAVSPLPSM